MIIKSKYIHKDLHVFIATKSSNDHVNFFNIKKSVREKLKIKKPRFIIKKLNKNQNKSF